MVSDEKKEIYKGLIALSSKTVLLSLFDLAAVFGSFDHRKRYARAYDDYLAYRSTDYQKFYKLLYRLKTADLVEVYYQDKEKFIRLTQTGRQKIAQYLFEDRRVPRPEYWDGKWRIIIFDIPEHLKRVREIVRQLLDRIGCYRLQKSVYVYPHECIGIIRYLEEIYDIDPYIQFIVAERIETEVDLIRHFHDQKILNKLKNKISLPESDRL